VAPTSTSSFRLDSTTFICGGHRTSIGWMSASGTVGSSLQFSGTFSSPNGCAGIINGTLQAGLIVGTHLGSCGTGTIAGTQIGVPNPGSGLVLAATVSATMTFV
jgi:hypothetical protein